MYDLVVFVVLLCLCLGVYWWRLFCWCAFMGFLVAGVVGCLLFAQRVAVFCLMECYGWTAACWAFRFCVAYFGLLLVVLILRGMCCCFHLVYLGFLSCLVCLAGCVLDCIRLFGG